jgi:hypothetical protein
MMIAMILSASLIGGVNNVTFPVTWVGQLQGLHGAGNKACCGEAAVGRVLKEVESMDDGRV